MIEVESRGGKSSAWDIALSFSATRASARFDTLASAWSRVIWAERSVIFVLRDLGHAFTEVDYEA